MIHITLPEDKERRLVFYLAMEEYLTEHCDGEMFFLWQVAPTVIFGRNQVMEAEVNIDYCERNGIQYYRRKSGGGCVFADWGNVMVSYITPRMAGTDVFAEFLDKFAKALGTFGFDAVRTERNDMLIEGYKVSGNAFFMKENACIVHGTLLYNVDMTMLQQAISPSKEKLSKHGIQSVRQRVVNLKELGISISCEEMKQKLVDYFCDSERMLTKRDIQAIEKIEKGYLDPSFLRSK